MTSKEGAMRGEAAGGERVPAPTPCRRGRREFLWETGAGFTGAALTWMLAQDGFFAKTVRAGTTAAGGASTIGAPLAAKEPHFGAKAKRCIFLFNYGGPSQVDTFDPKPELNRRDGEPMPNVDADPLFKARSPGKLLGTRRKFLRAGKSGIEVCDLFPNVAQHIDDIAVIRSCHADSFAHGSGLLQMNTGFLRQGHPCLGSWVVYGLGTENQNLPAFVVMLDHRGGPISGPPNWGSGYMPAVYQGTQFRVSGPPVLDLLPPEGTTAVQQRQQLDLLRTFNKDHHARLPGDEELRARLESYELAFRMQSHAPEAVDLGSETERTRKLYGLDDSRTEKFARRCLMARRLIERGVRFVQVYSGGGHNDENWDAHGDVENNHILHCGETDKPIAGLLADLKARGLLDETLVVWGSEFGRTPTAQNGKGRDHNPRGFSTWMAGGGVKGGQVYGATDEFGFRAVDKPVHVHDLHATMLHLMGLHHEHLTYFHAGRDRRLTDVSGRVLVDLVA